MSSILMDEMLGEGHMSKGRLLEYVCCSCDEDDLQKKTIISYQLGTPGTESIHRNRLTQYEHIDNLGKLSDKS